MSLISKALRSAIAGVRDGNASIAICQCAANL